MPQRISPRPRILVIDDDPQFTEDLLGMVGNLYHWTVRHDFTDAQAAVRRENPDLVLLDIGSPDDPHAGFGALAELTAQPGLPPVIMLTASESRDMVVRAISGGAVDFESKSDLRHSPAGLLRKVANTLGRRLSPDDGEDDGGMVVADPASRRLVVEIERIAPTPYAVLIHGETGTGKELVAGRLHALSRRKDGPLQVVNCAALPAELLETTLFGSVPGAYTGAIQLRRGAFETAAGGTLFLDEVGAASLALQQKLLRVLETGDYQRVGSPEVLYADVRLIAATNRDPQAAMDEGQLSPDFYYRVADYELNVAPLRKRRGDILPLARRFLDEAVIQTGSPARELSAELQEALQQYEWPGNVRQLRNEIRRAVVRAGRRELGLGGFLGLTADADLDERTYAEAKQELLDGLEKRYAIQSLERTGGVIQEAARRMGVSRQHLHRIIKKHGLSTGPDREGLRRDAAAG